MYIVGMSHGSKGKLVHGFGDTRLTISKSVVYFRACMKWVAQNMNYNQKKRIQKLPNVSMHALAEVIRAAIQESIAPMEKIGCKQRWREGCARWKGRLMQRTFVADF